MKPFSRGQVRLGQGLVLSDALTGNDRVPAQAVPLGRVDDHPKAEDGERGADIFLPQLGQHGGEIGPCLQVVGGLPPDIAPVFGGESFQAVFGDDGVQRHAVGIIVVTVNWAVLSHVDAQPQRPAAQFIGQPRPVFLETILGPGLGQSVAETGMPIKDRASGVKGKGFYIF